METNKEFIKRSRRRINTDKMLLDEKAGSTKVAMQVIAEEAFEYLANACARLEQQQTCIEEVVDMIKNKAWIAFECNTVILDVDLYNAAIAKAEELLK